MTETRDYGELEEGWDDLYEDDYDDDYEEEPIGPLSSEEKAGRWADLCLFALLLGAPQLLGIVHLWTWILALVLSSIAAGLALFAHEGEPVLPPRPLLLALGVATLASMLALLPLPAGLLSLLSPKTAALWEAAGSPRTWPCIHPDPGAGALALLRILCAGLVAVTTALRTQHRKFSRQILVLIALSGLAAAALAAVQSTYGLFPILVLFPGIEAPDGRYLAPLLNDNHWAGYTTLGALVALNLGLSERESPQFRLLAGVAACALATSALASGSRGAPIGLLIGLVATVSLRLLGSTGRSARRQARDRLTARAVVLSAAMATAAGCTWLVIAQTPENLDPHSGLDVGGLEDEGRLQMIPSLWALVQDFPWTGVGRGGFYDIFPQYQEIGAHSIYRWAEVFPADAVAAYGIPLGCLLLISLLWLMAAAAKASISDPDRAGAAGALIALAAHEMADFSTETGAVLLTSIVLAGVALSDKGQAKAPRWGIASFVVTPLLLALALQPALKHWDARAWIDRSTAEVEGNQLSLEDLANDSRKWHPASFPNALAIAELHSRRGETDKAMRWLNAAQQLAPTHPLPHLMTARLLRALGAAPQALLEYRLTLEHGWRSHTKAVVAEVLRGYETADDLLAILPKNRPEALGIIALLVQGEGDPRGRALGRKALDEGHQYPAAIVAGAFALMKEGEIASATSIVKQTWERSDLSIGVRFRLARVAGDSGDTGQELLYLEHICGVLGAEDPWIWLRLGQLRIEKGDWAGGRIALRKARWGTEPGRYTALSLYEEARLEELEGRSEVAVQMAERAVEVDGNLLEAQLLIARLQLAMGRIDRAARAHQRALDLNPSHKEVIATGEAIRAQSQRQRTSEPR